MGMLMGRREWAGRVSFALLSFYCVPYPLTPPNRFESYGVRRASGSEAGRKDGSQQPKGQDMQSTAPGFWSPNPTRQPPEGVQRAWEFDEGAHVAQRRCLIPHFEFARVLSLFFDSDAAEAMIDTAVLQG